MKKHLLSTAFLVMVFGLLFSIGLPQRATDDHHDTSAMATITGDYYTVTGPAEHPYDTTDREPGAISYCPLDDLDRAVCAYGELTSTLRQSAQDRGRREIAVNPAGWPSANETVTIPALAGVAGSTEYHGWLWNRSHLVADSLGGDPVTANLVTGTRTQNVGSVDNSGGMAYTETLARDYLDTTDTDSCPLYYAVTPVYTGDELIPRSVNVDVKSCDGSIDEHVAVENAANGFTIDYAHSSWTEN